MLDGFYMTDHCILSRKRQYFKSKCITKKEQISKGDQRSSMHQYCTFLFHPPKKSLLNKKGLILAFGQELSMKRIFVAPPCSTMSHWPGGLVRALSYWTPLNLITLKNAGNGFVTMAFLLVLPIYALKVQF